MAKQKKTTKGSGGRGSAEAILKRRVARHLNSILLGGGGVETKIDGRTEKRRQRLIKELVGGKGGEGGLKPIELVSHVDELLSLGETLASLKKAGVKPRKTVATPDVVEAVTHAQQAYSFRPEAWRMLGLKLDEIVSASASKATKGAKGRGRRGAKKA